MGSDPGLDRTAVEDPSSAGTAAFSTSLTDPEPTMPVASVARRLGVAPSTLRTWDRRYGLGPSKHTGGRHRRYRASDIVRLELMQRALLQGASTAEAARYALERAPKHGMPEAVVAAESVSKPLLRADDAGSAKVGRLDAFEVEGFATALLARRLSHAALAMDARAVQLVLAEIIREAGVLSSWQAVIQPVLHALTRREDRIRQQVEAEYLLKECVIAALIRATPVMVEPRNPRPVFLVRVPGEPAGSQPLPLYALAASLAQRGIGSQLFGMPLPPNVLTAVVRRGTPAALVLLSSRAATADPGLFEIPNQSRHRSRFFAFDEGWLGVQLPSKVESLPNLVTALERLEHVLVGPNANGSGTG